MLRSISICAPLAAALVLAAPSRAEAYGIGDALVACVSQDSAILDGIITHFVGVCNVKKGAKSACQATEGDPWVCNNKVGPSEPADQPHCFGGGGKVFIKLGASTTLPTGWKIEGEVNAELSHGAVVKESRTCGLEPKAPPASDGRAGKYVDLSGELLYYATFKVDGKLTVSGPGGAAFTLEAGGSCGARATSSVYREEATAECKAPKPCTKLPGTPSASAVADECVEEPLPEEPLPDPTPDPTPDPIDPTPVPTSPQPVPVGAP